MRPLDETTRRRSKGIARAATYARRQTPGIGLIAASNALFQHVRAHQPLSRIQLSRMTGVSAAVITEEILHLQRAGLVQEGARVESKTGRPSIMLQTDPALVIYAVVLKDSKCLLGIVTLQGHVRAHTVVAHGQDAHASSAQIIATFVRLSEASQAACKPFAIGIADARSVNGQRLHTAAMADVKRLGDAMRQVFEVPVAIGSDLQGRMLYDISFGNGANTGPVLGVDLSQQLPGALRIIAEFTSSSDLPLGHLCVDPNGPKCPCGRRGCWCLYASEEAVTGFYTGKQGRMGMGDWRSLQRAASRNEPAALAALGRQADGLMKGLRLVLRILWPDVIVLYGRSVKVLKVVVERLAADMSREFVGATPPLILSRQVGKLRSIQGAAAIGWFAPVPCKRAAKKCAGKKLVASALPGSKVGRQSGLRPVAGRVL